MKRLALVALCVVAALLACSPSLARRSHALEARTYAVYLPLVAQAGTQVAITTTVHPAPDRARAASGAIGPGGGTLRATAADGSRLTLTLPAGSLLFTETISLTPLAAIPDLPMGGGLIAGAQIEPDGLQLLAPGSLTIEPAISAPIHAQTFFGYTGAGEDLRLYAPQPEQTAMVLPLYHFSGYGVGSAGDAERLALIQAAPDGSEARIAQQQAELLRETRAAQGGGLDQLADKIEPLARAYFENVVRPAIERGLQSAQLYDVGAALRAIFAWERGLQLVGSDALEVERAYALAQVEPLLRHAADIVGAKCTQQHDFSQLSTLLQLERQAQLLGIQDHTAWDWISRCLTFRLDFNTDIDGMTQTEEGTISAKYHLRAQVTLRATTPDLLNSIWQQGATEFQGEGQLQLSGFSYQATFAECSVTAPTPTPGIFTVQRVRLRWGREGEALVVKQIEALVDVGSLKGAQTMTCPEAPAITIPTDFFRPQFSFMHQDEQSGGEGVLLVRDWMLIGGQIVGTKLYDRTRVWPGPNPVTVSEHTSFDLLHQPFE